MTAIGKLRFAVPIFLGAFLLFQVQPLIGKFILPWFGGATAVWTVCLLFFQCALLAGYAYAHGLSRIQSPRIQFGVHLAIVLIALSFLPLRTDPQWKPVPGEDPTWNVLGLLATSVGVPYVMLAATSPLLQAWYSRVHSGEPYRLYALSNVGSLLALLTFPFLFEPLLTRNHLANFWSIGFVGFAVSLVFCAFRLGRASVPASPSPAPSPLNFWHLVLWIALPACASSLLLATTNKICQDIAVVPFLWVLPLSLYLLSFIICFDSPAWYSRALFGGALALFSALTCYALFEGVYMPIVAQIIVFTGTLFAFCMVLHGELYRLRPAPERLTAYYLAIAFGGALGGAFVGLAAPVIFETYVEFQCTLVFSVFLLACVYARENTILRFADIPIPAWTILGAGALVMAGTLWLQATMAERNVIARERNFYGLLRVFDYPATAVHSHTRRLNSGDITHGEQFVLPLYAQIPTTYYHDKSGIGLALQAMAQIPNRRIGGVGLGIGTLAAYTQNGDTIRFYEINPAAKRLADNYFTYLENATGKVEVVFGDARLCLEREPPQRFHILAVDAFSGDAIPVHLLTREAFAVYLRHLDPQGVLAVHVTNRHLDLLPVVQKLAQHFGLYATLVAYTRKGSETWRYPSKWMLLTRGTNVLDTPEIRAASAPIAPARNAEMWTDDYASLLPLIHVRE